MSSAPLRRNRLAASCPALAALAPVASVVARAFFMVAYWRLPP